MLSMTPLLGHGSRMAVGVSPRTAISASVRPFQCGRTRSVIFSARGEDRDFGGVFGSSGMPAHHRVAEGRATAVVAARPWADRTAAGCRFVSLLAKRLQVEDHRQHGAQDGVPSGRMHAISVAAVIAIFIAATEALAEVVAVVVPLYVEATISVVPILIGIRIPVIERPAIVPVCLSSPETLLIAIVHGLPEHDGAVLIRLVISASTRVPIAWRRVEVGVTAVVVVGCVLDTQLLLTEARDVLLLKIVLRQTLLSLLLIQLVAILHQPLLLLTDKLLLLLLWQTPLQLPRLRLSLLLWRALWLRPLRHRLLLWRALLLRPLRLRLLLWRALWLRPLRLRLLP